jgi:RNA polymerase sigma-70 factor (ECF subfamily)
MGFAIDKSIIGKAASGDGAALGGLLTAVRPQIEKQLRRYPLTDEDRRDLVQTTLLQVIRRVGSFRGESSFSTWLFRVTANEALMMMRSQRRHRSRLVQGLDMEELGSLPAANDRGKEYRGDDVADASERDARVRNAVNELPASYRAVVVLHYNDDLGLHEIAARLSTTESAVRSRLHRARTQLRQILDRPVALTPASQAA